MNIAILDVGISKLVVYGPHSTFLRKPWKGLEWHDDTGLGEYIGHLDLS